MKNTQTLYQAFCRSAAANDKSPALLYLGKKISYNSVQYHVDKLARALKNSGIKSGDIVMICLPNIPEAVYSIYAANSLNAVAYPVHPLSNKEQVSQMLQKSGAKIIFALDRFAQDFYDICKKHGVILISCSPAGQLGFFKRTAYNIANKAPKNIINYSEFEKSGSNISADECDSSCDGNICTSDSSGHKTAVLLNSGGTGGIPKVVELSDYAINSLCSCGLELLCVDNVKGKFMLSALPYFHGFGLTMGLHAMLSLGGCNVLIPKFRRKYAMRYILKKQINYMIGVPALYGAVMSHKKFKGRLLKEIHVAFVGGDFVPQTLIDNFNMRMIEAGSGGRMYEGYGLTETASVCAVNTHNANKSGSVGKPIALVSIKAFSKIDDSGADNTEAQVFEGGELCIAGDTLMNGYYKDADANRQTFFEYGGMRWMRTGDYGFVDNEGYVYFKSRLKRIIKVSGVSVFPAEIEQAASEVEGVDRACAFDVYDKKKGNAVVLAIATKSENTEKLKAALSEHLSKKICVEANIKEIFFVKEFPLTAINKIDTLSLKELYGDRANQ